MPLSLLLVLGMNALSIYLPLGGRSMQQISAMYPHPLIPADWTFSVWSLIYLGLIAFAVYQLLPSMAADRVGNQLAALFCITAVLNSAWLIAWHFLWTGFSLAIMVLLATSVLLAYMLAVRKRSTATPARRLMIILPWRLYLGWIVVALALNIMAVLTAAGWATADVTPTTAALSLAGLGVVWGMIILVWKKDLPHTAVLVWAFTGITVGQWGNGLVPWVTAAAAILLVVLTVLVMFRKPKAAATAR